MHVRRLMLGTGAAVLTTLSASATTLPSQFAEDTLGTVSSPTALAIAGDGRVFVATQGGSLRLFKSGVVQATPVLALSVNSTGERGLLGVALDPNFASNSFVYLFYTTAALPIHNRISRFTLTGDVASLGSELVLLDLENLNDANHNGGAIHFGPDGKLYVGVGENAVASNAQSLSTRLGKLLRVNADGSIPTDNPFFSATTGVNRSIWALGLRNPYNFAFQPNSGRLLINDVGENTWEEINDGVVGSNYGWPTVEGPSSAPQFRTPLYSYNHGSGCAIVGGTFYNPAVAAFPSGYVGKYFFADFCSSWIKMLDPALGTVSDFASAAGAPIDMAVHPDGTLYFVERNSSSLRRIRYTGATVVAAPAAPPNSLAFLGLALAAFGVFRARQARTEAAA